VIKEKAFQVDSSEIHLIDTSQLDMNDLQVLKPHEYERFMNMKANKRRKEYLGARILLNEIDPSSSIVYRRTGKPRISNSEISISHCNEYVAIALNTNYDIGIDLQFIKPKIDNIKDKFLTNAELNRFEHDADTLTNLWSIKESCYKLFDEFELNFKENIDIFQDEGGYFAECLCDKKKYKVPFHIFTFENFKLAINKTSATII
jgi:phosphopantetheinyl transferase